jgi:hypothetical protein
MDFIFNEIKNSNSHEILKNVNNNVDGRKFHDHTHILYDIRTLLGPELKNYTEIGAYIGSSSCLLLQHNFPTNITCIDPLNLHNNHFQVANISQEDLLKNNLNKNNIHNRNIDIKKNYSNDSQLLNDLNTKNFRTDILFIDGSHLYQDVINDFLNYFKFVNIGGYILFDDYNDKIHGPEVKTAVDYLVNLIKTNNMCFEIIGCVKNFRSNIIVSDNNDSNIFILKVKENFIKIGLCCPTYYRKNKSTKEKLLRCLNLIKNQSYQNFKLYLIGDCYDNNDEFKEICESFPPEKIYYENREEHFRDKLVGIELWCLGGGGAMMRGIEKMYEDGCTYYFHIDDDEIWDLLHIETIVNGIINFPHADFLFTASHFLSREILPREQRGGLHYNNITRLGGNIVHSAQCFKLNTTYNLFQEIKKKFYDHIYNQKKIQIHAWDHVVLNSIEKCRDDKIHNILYLPKITCTKLDEQAILL